MVYMQSNLQLLSRKDEGYNCIKKSMIHLMMVFKLELTKLSHDESNLEAMLCLDDGNKGEE